MHDFKLYSVIVNAFITRLTTFMFRCVQKERTQIDRCVQKQRTKMDRFVKMYTHNGQMYTKTTYTNGYEYKNNVHKKIDINYVVQ